MNQEIRRKVYESLAAAGDLGHTPEAVALAEEAVQLADAHNDAELGYQARMRLMELAVFAGDSDKLLVAFSWCLAYADKQPQNHFEWELLWKYKWVVDNLAHFPRISRAQIFAALEDFQARCRKAGYNDRAALFLHWTLEMQLGDPVEARKWQAQWRVTQRDGMADCEACEINRVAELQAMLGEHETAIQLAGPILQGRKRCGEIPHLTYATLLRSIEEARGASEAAIANEKGYRLVRSNRDFIREQAWHAQYLLRTGQMDRATTLIRRHLPWALETHNLDYQFHFLLATRTAMRRLAKEGAGSMRLRLREKLCPVAGKTTVPIKPFSDWLDAKIGTLVADFDRRNNNQWFSKLAAENDATG